MLVGKEGPQTFKITQFSLTQGSTEAPLNSFGRMKYLRLPHTLSRIKSKAKTFLVAKLTVIVSQLAILAP